MIEVNWHIDSLIFSFIFPQAAGFPEPEIVHYNPKEFDFGKKKAFPFRDQVIGSLKTAFSVNMVKRSILAFYICT